jgi:cyclopropane-fatty-acyl-phospholipid synthase
MSQDSATTSTAPLATRDKPSFFRAAVLKAFGAMTRGHLRLELPDGHIHEIGSQADASARTLPLAIPAAAHLRIRRENFFTKCALAGDIGFAEAYIDGDWETPNLTAVIAFFILNADTAPTLSGSSQARTFALNSLRSLNRLGHLLRPNSRATAQRNISEHYDLSNDFFALFLDPSMMYSAAKWSSPTFTLEAAQREKNDALCRHLRLQPTDHVLEIGTGWGGWSLHAARTYGCRVTTVTISREQLEYARARIAAAGLSDRISVEFRDYRDLHGSFDKIVSTVISRNSPRCCIAA